MASKRSPRGFELRPELRLFERHVQLEDFFQQFGRHIFRPLLADVEAFEFQQILGPGDRVAQRPVGVVQDRSRLLGACSRSSALFRA